MNSEEILINVTPKETRVALLEQGVLQEIYIERKSRKGLVGNIYKGKVVRILPGMQAAFVDIGLERAAFLHVSDMQPPQFEQVEQSEPPCITQLLQPGQSLIVQVTKDELGGKGARLTTQLAIPSRFLVFMPNLSHIGISQRIENEAERARLKELLEASLPEKNKGYILRTAAEGATTLTDNIIYLNKLWDNICAKAKSAKEGDIIHEDIPLELRALRDLVSPYTEKIRIDAKHAFSRAQEFINHFMPALKDKVEYYQGIHPLFDLHGVEDDIQRALQQKVVLKSGGYLVFDQTEAMSTIDVNTGGFVGHRNLEETIFKTNLEAAQTIARQIRLRNLGGIIIIDFIDMNDEEHKRQVLRVLEKALAKDHAKSYLSNVSSLGLVQMTRKRSRESLEHSLCEACMVCNGRGTIKTAETVCYEIFREILRAAKSFDAKHLLVLASQSVVDRLLDEESSTVMELEDELQKIIKFQVETSYQQEQYDVVIL